MSKPKAIGIYREIKLAGKPGADQMILDFTAKELEKKGFDVSTMFPSQFIKERVGDRDCDLIFTMARDAGINDYLSLIKDNKPVFAINSPASIRVSFNRFLTYSKVAESGVRIPEAKVYTIDELKFSDIEGKAILKPANRHEYWFVIEKQFHFDAAIETYRCLGINEVMVQKFVKGEDLKFYAIGEKVIISKTVRENFPEKTIKEVEENVLAIEKATGLKILGGDFVIDPKDDNKVYCVDINDWPSFGTIGEFSQEEAGLEITNLIVAEFEKFKNKK
jgi:glutathione synthase/RimK-type ligase-like ATP-grasp enzyme